jgi:hypothetical protein
MGLKTTTKASLLEHTDKTGYKIGSLVAGYIFSIRKDDAEAYARKVMGIHGCFVRTIHQYAMPDVAY